VISATYSDVLFPIYSSDEFVVAASVEKIFSFEKRLVNSISILPWGGTAIFWPFYQKRFGGPVAPALGIEAAIESRWYPICGDLSGLFVGLYGGGAFMFPSYAAIGASAGIKAGYKKVIKSKQFYRFSFEPYGSLSTLPVVHSTYYKSDELLFFPGLIVTFGIRIVSQWGKI
jgi:hypothetical protein